MKNTASQPMQETSTKKQLQGVVVSDKMKDTVVVRVERYFKHPKYKKFISRSKRFMAHDAGNTRKVGDKVTIEEIPPMSRHKHFRVI
jgi:small subunit ribosomal protein S17